MRSRIRLRSNSASAPKTEDELAAVGGSVILLGQTPIADPPLGEDQDNFDQQR